MEELTGRIMRSEYAAGERLPVESDLLNELGVSRTALREAFRTMAAKGLVKSRKKAGTFVLPQSEWNVLDAEVLGWIDKAGENPAWARMLTEVRMIFEPKAARLAALRSTASDRIALTRAFEGMADVSGRAEKDRLEADLDFHRAILAASQNDVLRHLGSVIESSLRNLIRASNRATSDFERGLEAHGKVLTAILARDADGADRAMMQLISVAFDDLSLHELMFQGGDAE